MYAVGEELGGSHLPQCAYEGQRANYSLLCFYMCPGIELWSAGMHNKHSSPLGPLLTLIVHFLLFSFPFFFFFILLPEFVYWIMVYCSLF